MYRSLVRTIRSRFRRRGKEIAPDEIFMDAHNLPQFDQHQMEGRLVTPLSQRAVFLLVVLFALVGLIFAGQLFRLQVVRGEAYAERSTNNRLAHIPLFADRGVILDRAGRRLAWNTPNPHTNDYALRTYATSTGLAHVLGYVKYPQKDSGGIYYQTRFVGTAGVERLFDDMLGGTNGQNIIELDARGNKISESTFSFPQAGDTLELSIDAQLQHVLHEEIKTTAHDFNYEGGSGVILDITTGEIIALTSYPEYDPQKLTDGDDAYISSALTDSRQVFLNRAVQGLYTPGSTVKPYMAAAALAEEVITPDEYIYSSGQISIPNPFVPDNPSVFRDWKAHGAVNMVEALAVSSNVYFYEIGGGFNGRDGLGIERIAHYMSEFGFGRPVGPEWAGEAAGSVPTPEWKAEMFDGEPWRLGDTYHTSIGQYGFQVTPLQAVRAIGAIANGGTLVTPRLTRRDMGTTPPHETVAIAPEHLAVAADGMRRAVTDGTAGGLNLSDLSVAAKTGTAEIGAQRQYINSWVVGFFPYEDPRYAFAVVMEEGPRANVVGGVRTMRAWFDRVRHDHPEFY